MNTDRLIIHPITGKHLRFLLKLWNDVEVMRYAGSARNWEYETIEKWYERYKQRVIEFGTTETQFVIRLKNGKLIGESGLGTLRTGWGCRDYQMSRDESALMADVKLVKSIWNQGFGTEAMEAIVGYVFGETDADLFLVPPHRDNPPAVRVYEKAGFRKTKGVWYRYHLIYEMTREEFDTLHRSRRT